MAALIKRQIFEIKVSLKKVLTLRSFCLWRGYIDFVHLFEKSLKISDQFLVLIQTF
jgi:hypothetical protein